MSGSALGLGILMLAATAITTPAQSHEGLDAVSAQAHAWVSDRGGVIRSEACALKQSERHVCLLRVDYEKRKNVRVILTNGNEVTYPSFSRGGTR